MNSPVDMLVQIARHFQLPPGVDIAWSAFIGDKVTLEKNVVVQPHARLEHSVLLGRRATVGRYAVLSNVEVGEGSHIEYGVIVTGYGNGRIKIGRECYIGIYNVLDWSDDLVIGDFVHIAGPSTGLWTHSSVQQVLTGDALDDKRKRETKPINIEDHVYIGGNCTIYPGVTIGHHSVVAPNSAVTEDVLPNTMVGGVPARIIKDTHGASQE